MADLKGVEVSASSAKANPASALMVDHIPVIYQEPEPRRAHQRSLAWLHETGN